MIWHAQPCKLDGHLQFSARNFWRILITINQVFAMLSFSFLVESHGDRGIEWRGILHPSHPVFLQHLTTHRPCILQRFWHTLWHDRIYSSQKQNNWYSRNDFRSQLFPFPAIPRSWTWKRRILQTLKTTIIMKIATKNDYLLIVIKIRIRRKKSGDQEKRKFIL